MQPRAYSTPLIFFFHSGLPNQIANRSTFSPRQRAARKCPNSCTKMSRLKSSSTSSRMKLDFKKCIVVYRPGAVSHKARWEYSGGTRAGNGGVEPQKSMAAAGCYASLSWWQPILDSRELLLGSWQHLWLPHFIQTLGRPLKFTCPLQQVR